MTEVQVHGNKYEDWIVQKITGMSKRQYDKLKPNGYTHPFDLVKGLYIDYNVSIKSTKSNIICCGDILNKISHTDYHLIIGAYRQVLDKKIFHTQYEFHITPYDYITLWGDMTYESVEPFVNYVKSIPEGSEGQLKTRQYREEYKKIIQCDKALFVINPKVDSKKQRRVQCSTHLTKLINSGIYYTSTPINYIVKSPPRSL